MEVVHPRCAGLDVHKRLIVACRLTPGGRGHPIRDVESFRTTTRCLLDLSACLAGAGITVVAMEITGCWKLVVRPEALVWIVRDERTFRHVVSATAEAGGGSLTRINEAKARDLRRDAQSPHHRTR
jgi:hypothetical protein